MGHQSYSWYSLHNDGIVKYVESLLKIPFIFNKYSVKKIKSIEVNWSLAVKNTYTNLEHTNRFLSIIDPTHVYFLALVPARELAIKNIRKPWTRKSVSLKSQKSIELVFMFCSCTSQGTSCQKYTQTLNSQIAPSQIDRTWSIELDRVYFLLLHQPRN